MPGWEFVGDHVFSSGTHNTHTHTHTHSPLYIIHSNGAMINVSLLRQ